MTPDLSLAAKIYKLKSLLATDKRMIESRKLDYPPALPHQRRFKHNHKTNPVKKPIAL